MGEVPHTHNLACYLRVIAGSLRRGLIVLKAICVIIAVVKHQPIERLHQLRPQVDPGPSPIFQFNPAIVRTEVVAETGRRVHTRPRSIFLNSSFNVCRFIQQIWCGRLFVFRLFVPHNDAGLAVVTREAARLHRPHQFQQVPLVQC